MAACTGFAVVLWLYVAGLEPDTDPVRPSIRDVTVAVHFLHSRFPFLRALPADSQTANVTVQSASPLPEHLIVQARADLASITAAGVYTVPVTAIVQSPDDDATNVTVVPDRIKVFVDRESSRDVPVQFQAVRQPPAGFALGAPVLRPDHISVTGPSSLLTRPTAAVTYDVGAAQDSVVTLAPVTLGGLGDADPTWFHYHPDRVSLYLPILRQQSFATLPIEPTIDGSPAPGYRFRLEPDPAVATVSGPASVLRRTWVIPTRPIHLAGQSESFTARVRLAPADGLTLEGTAATVMVHVEISLAPPPAVTGPAGSPASPRTTIGTKPLPG